MTVKPREARMTALSFESFVNKVTNKRVNVRVKFECYDIRSVLTYQNLMKTA